MQEVGLAKAVELEIHLDPVAQRASSCRNASSRAIRMPLVLRTTRVTLRSTAARMISTISGWTVGSPPDSISASIRPPSRSIAVSSDRRMCGQSGVPPTPGAAVGEAGRALQIAVLGDVEQQDAAVLGLEVAEAVEVAHRDRPHVAGRVGHDLAGRDPPLLEVLPEGVVLLVQAHHLAVAALAVAAAGRPRRPSPRGCPGGCRSRSRPRDRDPR